MARWGEEEKKTKGIFSCAISATILLLAAYTFYINYQNLEGRRKLEAKMQDIVRKGMRKTEEQMIGAIVTEAEKLEIYLEPDDVELTKTNDDTGNYVVDVYINFRFDVNLLITKVAVNIPIAEKVTLII